MASPQIENGHLDVANEIVEYLCHYRISGEEYQVIWAIWRKTWAWHKLDERISLKEFAKLTEMKKPSIIRAIKKLIDKRIISVSKKANVIAPTYRFNKNYDTWKTLAKKLTYKFVSKKANDVSKKANFAAQKPTTDKEKLTSKETIKRKNIYIVDFEEKLWPKYPLKDGRKQALKYFDSSVKTEEDLKRITTALDNYLSHLKRETWKRPKNGSTWFNNWEDWVDIKIKKAFDEA